MLYILISIFVVAITYTLIAKFMLWYAKTTTHASLTSRFQDAECIVNEHRAPESWRKPAPFYTRLVRGDLLQISQFNADTHSKLLKRLDNLIAFFEQSRFFDNPETKAQLLDELRLERKRWESLSTEVIFSKEHSESKAILHNHVDLQTHPKK